MKRLFALTLILVTTLTACNQTDKNTLLVGTIAGPETALVNVAQTVAFEQYHLPIKVVEFNDYNLPNAALEDGSLDVNVYQHLPYLEAAKKAHGYDLVVVGKTFIYPMAIYSKRVKSLSALPENATIAIPNDPSNEERALMVLEQAGLIKLTPEKRDTLDAISDNPKHLRFKALDAAQLPRVLQDVDAAVINTTFAKPAGLHLKTDALFVENRDSPYANLIVIKRGTLKKEQIDLFIQAMHSQAVKDKAVELFGESAIPAW